MNTQLLIAVSCCLSILVTNLSAQKYRAFDASDTTNHAIQLKEVRINASGKQTPLIKSFREAAHHQSLDQILKAQTGIHMISRGAYANEVVIRGMSAGQVDVSIDGMKIVGACTDRMDPVNAYIEPVNLGGLTLEHGTGALALSNNPGGALNMKMSEASLGKEPSISGLAGIGYYNNPKTINTFFMTNYGQKKWGFRVSGIYRAGDNYKDGREQVVEHSQYNKANFSATLKTLVSSHTVFQANVLYDDAWDIGYPSLPMDVLSAKALIASVSLKQYDLGNFISTWEQKLYWNTIRHQMDDTQREETIMHMDMPGKSRTTGFYSHIQAALTKKWQLEARVDGHSNRLLAEMIMYPDDQSPMYMQTWPDVLTKEAGLFISSVVKPDSITTLTIATRIGFEHSRLMSELGREQWKIFGYDLSTGQWRQNVSASVRYAVELSHQMTIFASANAGNRLPSTSEQYGYYLFNKQDGYDYLGNPSLKNEKVMSMESGLRVKAKKLQASGSVFGYFYGDYILGLVNPGLDIMTIGARGVRQYGNIESARLLGFELDLQARPAKHVDLGIGATYTSGTDHEGNALPLIPPLRFDFEANFDNRKIFATFQINHHLAQSQINAEFYENKTPAYTLLNVRMGARMKTGFGKIEIIGRVENLLDAYYVDHLSISDIPGAGRNAGLLVQIGF